MRLKRILASIVISVCTLTTFVAVPASADEFSYNCNSGSWGWWYGNAWGNSYGPDVQIPFNLSTGESTNSTIHLDVNGYLRYGNIAIRGADPAYYWSNWWWQYYQSQYRQVVIQYGWTASTVCVSWTFDSVYGQRTTTLRLAILGSGTFGGTVDGYENHWTGNSYPNINGNRFDSMFVMSDDRFYPYAAIPSSIKTGSAVADSVTLGYTLHDDIGGNAATDYHLQYRRVGDDWQNYAHEPAVDGSATVSGLDAATNYEFRIASETASGMGPWSEGYFISTKARPASPPTISDYVTSSKSVELKIQNPAIIGDVSLTDYEYSVDDGSNWKSFKTATGPFVITGLTNATSYPIRVRAINTAGAGEASERILAIPTQLVPISPQVQLVSVGNETATLSIEIPSDDTAKSVTSYQYNVNRGVAWKPCVLIDRSCTIVGLINGTKSKLRIRAVNSNGFGAPSSFVEAVTRTISQPPIIKSVVSRVRSLIINYQPPADNGGSIPTSYEYSIDGGQTWTLSTAKLLRPIEVTGLSNATNYDVSLRAINAAGTGLPAQIVRGKTLAVLAKKPTILSLIANQTSLTFSFSAPTDDGGEISNYAYSLDWGRTWTVVPVPADSRIVISNLAPSTPYGFRLRVINSAGGGAPSITEVVRTLH